jgi:hypothetical protein
VSSLLHTFFLTSAGEGMRWPFSCGAKLNNRIMPHMYVPFHHSFNDMSHSKIQKCIEKTGSIVTVYTGIAVFISTSFGLGLHYHLHTYFFLQFMFHGLLNLTIHRYQNFTFKPEKVCCDSNANTYLCHWQQCGGLIDSCCFSKVVESLLA